MCEVAPDAFCHEALVKLFWDELDALEDVAKSPEF
jgi:hypothetical protein